jgi:hypothetical protein
MSDLALQKYRGGRATADSLIAGPGGWTPGNHQAAANVASGMGIGPHDDLKLTDPGRMFAFQRSLAKQEGAPNLLRQFVSGSASKSISPAPKSTGPKLPIPSLSAAASQSMPEAEAPSDQSQYAPRRRELPQQQADNAPMARMPESEPSPPRPPIDVRPFAPQQQQQPQQPQQAADQGGLSLPRVGSEADLKKLSLKPGQGFIGPDGKTHWVPFPSREAAA